MAMFEGTPQRKLLETVLDKDVKAGAELGKCDQTTKALLLQLVLEVQGLRRDLAERAAAE